jgi:hypothetical protein
LTSARRAASAALLAALLLASVLSCGKAVAADASTSASAANDAITITTDDDNGASVRVVIGQGKDAPAVSDGGHANGQPSPPPRMGIIANDKRIRVSGSGRSHDGDYDSFDELAEKAPWIPVVAILGTVLTLLTPLILIALIIWYKMRKNRMLNETMLRLVERGVMPPAEALTALGAEVVPPAASASDAVYAQAKALRGQRMRSDLRRGMVMTMLGLALQTWALLDKHSINLPGLILLFLGGGYLILWFVEDRRQPSLAAGESQP